MATLPYEYAGRLIEVFVGEFEYLRLLVADRYDLALSKLPRNLDVDFEDVKHLARSPDFDLGTLKQRYQNTVKKRVSRARLTPIRSPITRSPIARFIYSTAP